jgi:hypothetical protein
MKNFAENKQNNKNKTMKNQNALIMLAGFFMLPRLGLSCWCWDSNGIYTGGTYEVVPGSVSVVDTIQVLATSDQSIGSNPCDGSSPPSKTYQAQGGTGTVLSWQVSGSVNYSYFGVSARAGGSVNYNANCTSSATINSWCSCCHERAGLKFTTTTLATACVIPDGGYCEYAGGSCVKFDNAVCDDQPACTIPSGCTTGCGG